MISPVDEEEVLADLFEEHRGRLRAVAYRMLGSLSEADDAVQEAWLRLSRTGADGIENLGGRLTTVVARLCLNGLRTREQRREDPLELHLPDPVISGGDGGDPEREALPADSVGGAGDAVTGRTAGVRAARHVRGPVRGDRRDDRSHPDRDPAACRPGSPPCPGTGSGPWFRSRPPARGRRRAKTVGSQAVLAGRLSPFARLAFVNGTPGAVVIINGKPVSIMSFTVSDGRIVSIEVIADPERLKTLDLPSFDA